MKKPFIRVTKWLGDIPVEAECTACPGVEKFRAVSASHRPNREEYQKALQRAFDEHIKTAHKAEGARDADAPIVRDATERDS
jgi:hypothetical protein